MAGDGAGLQDRIGTRGIGYRRCGTYLLTTIIRKRLTMALRPLRLITAHRYRCLIAGQYWITMLWRAATHMPSRSAMKTAPYCASGGSIPVLQRLPLRRTRR